MKNLKKIITIVILASTLAFSTELSGQSRQHFSTNSYYAQAWESYDYLQSWFYDYYGNYCENRMKMVWTRHYGQRSVQVWDNYRGCFTTNSYQYSYYWTYRWQNYTICN